MDKRSLLDDKSHNKTARAPPARMGDDCFVAPSPIVYERGDARVVFGENGTYSLWDAAVRLGVSTDTLVDINGGSDVVQSGQEMRVPRELILRGAMGLGSIGTGVSVGTKRDDHAGGADVYGGAGLVWRGEQSKSPGFLSLLPGRRDAAYQLPFPLVGAAAAARQDWSFGNVPSSLMVGPADRPDLFLLEPELDRLPDAKPDFREFLAALRWVETRNQMPAPVGDEGASIGPFQISREYHQDAWNPTGDRVEARRLEREYWRCDEVEYSERTVIRYMRRWCPWALRHCDFETLARVHNAGPRYKEASNETARYWWKVRRRAPHLMFGVARCPTAGLAVEVARNLWPRGLPASKEYEKPLEERIIGSMIKPGAGDGDAGSIRLEGFGSELSVQLRSKRGMGGFSAVEGGRCQVHHHVTVNGRGALTASNHDVVLQLPPTLAAVVGFSIGWPQKVLGDVLFGGRRRVRKRNSNGRKR